MFNLLLFLSFVTIVYGMEDIQEMFKPMDLLIVAEDCTIDGTQSYAGKIVLCLTSDEESTLAKVIIITKIGAAPNEYEFRSLKVSFPTKTLRAFSIKQSKKVSNESLLSLDSRWKIKAICKIVDNVIAAPIDGTSFEGGMTLCFGMIAHEFGVRGVFNAYNTHSNVESKEVYNQFSKKYLKIKHHSLASSAIQNNVKIGDLVFVDALKQQNDTDLQIRAQHFNDQSFGELIPFKSGDLIRTNSRNQNELAVQSLMDERLTLALRPKYLFKLPKIHIHKLSNAFPFAQFTGLVSCLLRDQNNKILYLPHKRHDLEIDQSSVFMLQQGPKANVIFDIAVSMINGLKMPCGTLSQVAHSIVSLPFVINMESWNHIIEKTKMGSNQIKLITKINQLYLNTYEKFMKMQIDKEQNAFTHVLLSWRREIEKGLSKFPIRKFAVDYKNFFELVDTELYATLSENHPKYLDNYRADPQHGDIMRIIQNYLRAMYRTSVIQNYLKGIQTGQDLHVICFGDQEHGFLEKVKAALAEQIHEKWDVDSRDVLDTIASRIIRIHHH